jgi:hypothetical protein
MSILATAVVIVGALCLTNLVLVFGIIRRLREHTALLSERSHAEVPVTGLGTGDTPPAFTVVTTEGGMVAGPAGLRLVAFFSSSCSLCPKRVPVFADYVRENRLGRDDVLAVILGDADEPVPYLDQLETVAQTRREPENGELALAFQVSGYPAFCLLDADGAVLASGYDPATLPAPVAA